MFGNIGKMMKLVGELKTRLPEMKQKLNDSRYEAQAGGGVVAAAVNGRMAVVDLRIDPSLLADKEMTAEMLADLIKAAVAAAQEQASSAAEAAMKELTGGVEIPGLGDLM